MEIGLMLAAFIVNLDLIVVQSLEYQTDDTENFRLKVLTKHGNDENKFQENFLNLFDSMGQSASEKTEIYRKVLKQEIEREREAFDALKEDISTAQRRNAKRKKKFHENSNIIATKRETNKNEQGAGASHKAAFFDAANRNDEEAVKRFVEENNVPVDSVNLFDETCAHIAAKNGNLNLVKYALKQDYRVLDTSDAFGNTVLTLAVQNGHLHIVQYLVDNHNANIFQPFRQIFGQPNAVHIAAESGQLMVLKYFVEEKKAGVNMATNAWRQPLAFSAARGKHHHIVKYLLEERNADLTLTDSDGNNILYMNVKESDLTSMKYLLDERKVDLDVNWRNQFGRAVLHLASFFDNVDILSYLVEEKGANVNIADNKGQTPLHRAALHNNFLSCKYLIEHGADVGLKDLNGTTPLEEARNQTFIDIVLNISQKRNRRSLPVTLSWIKQ